MKHIISLGAGVQSSTMALMAAHGEITPMPDAAIFADTGAEPLGVYNWLYQLEEKLPFPIYRVMVGAGLKANIHDSISGGDRLATPPFFTQEFNGKVGQLRRQCTKEYKIEPITKKIRELLGIDIGKPGGKEVLASVWMGISTDEINRLKPSLVTYITNRHPLIELGMSRTDCLKWMEAKGYPKPTKSACTFCPYHDDALWADMKANDPESWKEAVAIDEMIRGGVRGTVQKLYLHRTAKPLVNIDLRSAEDAGQLSMFDDECEGMCGL